MEKKNNPQVYLEECKHKIKKIRMLKFIDVRLESDDSSDSEVLILNDYNFLLTIMFLNFYLT